MKFLQLLFLTGIVLTFCNCSDDENKPLPVQAGKWAGVRVIQDTDSSGVVFNNDTFEVVIEFNSNGTGEVKRFNEVCKIIEWSVSASNDKITWIEIAENQDELNLECIIDLNEPQKQEWSQFFSWKPVGSNEIFKKTIRWYLEKEE